MLSSLTFQTLTPYNAPMTSHWKRWAVRLVKFVLALVVLFFIGWQFARDLRGDGGKPVGPAHLVAQIAGTQMLAPAGSPIGTMSQLAGATKIAEFDAFILDKPGLNLTTLEWRPGWLVASSVVYLVALFSGAWFWRHLLNFFGYPISLGAALRAHYIGQLGKYVPGKALAIAMRADLVHPLGVPYGVSVIASFYEVLTGMAAGATVAAIIYMIDPPQVAEVQWHPLWMGVLLIGMCGLPLLPGVFNFIIARLAARMQTVEQYRLPPVRFGTLARGLLVSAACWWLHGLSWWMMLQAVVPEPPEFSFAWWSQCTASIAFASVAGFVVFFLPAGLGARELLLSTLMRSFAPPRYLVPAAILLRLTGIVAEALFALCTYWIKPRSQGSGVRSQESQATP